MKNAIMNAVLVTTMFGYSKVSHAAANPIIDPPGGEIPTTTVPQNKRLIPQGSVQHIVCFKFKVPTVDTPVTLPSLQTLDPQNGAPMAGSAPQTLLTFTDLPSLIKAVEEAYYTEAKQVPYIRGFGGGENMSHEGTSSDAPNGFGTRYDICFSAVFANTNDRDFFVGNDKFPTKTDQHHHAFRNFVGGDPQYGGPAFAGDAKAIPAFNGNLMVFDYLQNQN